jgi:hypothetical protein
MQFQNWECIWESLGSIPCTLPHLWKFVSHQNTFSWPHGPLHSTLSHKPNVRVQHFYSFIVLNLCTLKCCYLISNVNYVGLQAKGWYFKKPFNFKKALPSITTNRLIFKSIYEPIGGNPESRKKLNIRRQLIFFFWRVPKIALGPRGGCCMGLLLA